MESIAIAELIEDRGKHKIDPDQELKGFGLANIAGAFIMGYPVTGGLSRTAENYQAGARTGLASMVTAAMVVMTLLIFTPLFRYLPKAALIIIGALQAVWIYLRHTLLSKSVFGEITLSRTKLGRSLSLGLEFLIGADILKTAVAPT